MQAFFVITTTTKGFGSSDYTEVTTTPVMSFSDSWTLEQKAEELERQLNAKLNTNNSTIKVTFVVGQ